jgi:hypothetical protein
MQSVGRTLGCEEVAHSSAPELALIMNYLMVSIREQQGCEIFRLGKDQRDQINKLLTLTSFS